MKKFLCSSLILLTTSSSLLASTENNMLNTNNDSLIATTTSETEDVTPLAQYGEITENNVHMRVAQGLSSTILRQLHQGYVVTTSYTPVVSKDGYKWQHIIYNGVEGWVAVNYLKYY